MDSQIQHFYEKFKPTFEFQSNLYVICMARKDTHMSDSIRVFNENQSQNNSVLIK